MIELMHIYRGGDQRKRLSKNFVRIVWRSCNAFNDCIWAQYQHNWRNYRFPTFLCFLKYAKNTGHHNSLFHPTSVFSQLDIFSLKLLKNFFEGMHVNCNLSSQPSQNYLSFHTNKKHTADNTSTSLSKVISY